MTRAPSQGQPGIMECKGFKRFVIRRTLYVRHAQSFHQQSLSRQDQHRQLRQLYPSFGNSIGGSNLTVFSRLSVACAASGLSLDDPGMLEAGLDLLRARGTALSVIRVFQQWRRIWARLSFSDARVVSMKMISQAVIPCLHYQCGLLSLGARSTYTDRRAQNGKTLHHPVQVISQSNTSFFSVSQSIGAQSYLFSFFVTHPAD